MAIEEQTARTVFKGDGSTRAFPVTWYLDAEENVIVKMTNVTTAQVKTLELGTDYTVTPSDDEYPTNGAVINYPKNSVTPALGNDYRLTVIRNVPYTQNFVFPNNTRLLPKNIEGGLDGLELQIQQVNDKADQSLRIPDGLDIDGEELVSSLYDASESAENSAEEAKQNAEEAKEALEATKEQAQIIEATKNEAISQIETTKNDAVANINDYTEQSYLNAKSVNIRQFKNVEAMKQATDITDNLLVSTQGFNTAGDGGHAQYCVLPEDNEEEPNGYSIIEVKERISGSKVGRAKVGSARTTAYKKRKLKLLVSQCVNVKWFGAKIDGVTDDSDAFNRAITFIKQEAENLSSYYSSYTLYVPKGVVKINRGINIDISRFNLLCDNTIIDARECEGIALTLAGSSNSPFGQNTNYVKGFKLIGNNTFGKTAVAYGNGQNAHGGLQECYITGFDKGIEYANNTYCDTNFRVNISNCNTAIHFPSGLTNAGERLTFISCTIHNNKVAVNNDAVNNNLFFTNCSFDYNEKDVILNEESIITFTGCHHEWEPNSNFAHWINNSKSGALIFKGCQFVPVRGTKSEFAFENNTQKTYGGILMDSISFMGDFESTYNYLLSGGGYKIQNSVLQFEPPRVIEPCKQFKFPDNLTENMVLNHVTASISDGKLTIQRSDSAYASFAMWKKLRTTDSAFFTTAICSIDKKLPDDIRVVMHTVYMYKNNEGNFTTIREQGSREIQTNLNNAFDGGMEFTLKDTIKPPVDLLYYSTGVYMYVYFQLDNFPSDTTLSFSRFSINNY